MSALTDIYECGVVNRVQYSQREDGQWFVRHQWRSMRGYSWSAWRPCASKPKEARLYAYAGKARLPS